MNETLKLYERGTGAKVNKEKTEILLLGTWTEKENQILNLRITLKVKLSYWGYILERRQRRQIGKIYLEK